MCSALILRKLQSMGHRKGASMNGFERRRVINVLPIITGSLQVASETGTAAFDAIDLSFSLSRRASRGCAFRSSNVSQTLIERPNTSRRSRTPSIRRSLPQTDRRICSGCERSREELIVAPITEYLCKLLMMPKARVPRFFSESGHRIHYVFVDTAQFPYNSGRGYFR